MRKSKRDYNSQQSKHYSHKKWLYIGTIIILVIVAITFLGGPAIRFWDSNSRGKIIFATYHGKDISYQSGNFFSYAYDAYADQIGLNSLNDEDVSFRLQLIWRQAYNDTLLRTATIDFAEPRGAYASRSAIDNAIIKLPRFQENDEFSIERYRNTTSQDLYQLSAVIKDDIIFNKVYTSLVDFVSFSNQEKDFFIQMGKDKYSFTIVPFEKKQYPNKELVQYFKTNKKKFQSFTLFSITFKGDKKDIQEYRRQIVDGEKTFEEQARLISTDRFADQGGLQGEIYAYALRNTYNDTIIQKILSLKKDNTSGVLEVSKGNYVLFKMGSEKKYIDIKKKENLTRIRDYIEQNDSSVLTQYLLKKAQEFKQDAQSNGFYRTVLQLSLKSYTLDPFPLNYGNITELGTLHSDNISGIAAGAFQEEFFKVFFSLSPGDVSDPVLIRETYYVALLDSITEDTPSISDNEYRTFVKKIKQNSYQSFIIKEKYLDNFFQESFDRYIRPARVEKKETSDKK